MPNDAVAPARESREGARMPCCVPATPCWVSLLSRDLLCAREFYGGLFGWTFQSVASPWGPYLHALLDDTVVAGLAEVARRWEFPVAWTTYFGTEDAGVTADRIRSGGGTVAVGPLAFDGGRVVLAADDQNAAFAAWQGAPVWTELRTRDAFATALFYGRVFGWDDLDSGRYEVRYEHDRVVLHVDGRAAAAIRGGGVEGSPEPVLRPRWHVFFEVEDVDRAAERAVRLGGRIVTAPAESAYGRVAAVQDPEGGLLDLASGPPGAP